MGQRTRRGARFGRKTEIGCGKLSRLFAVAIGLRSREVKSSLVSRWFSPDFPFRPGKSRIHYGWIIAVIGTIGIICSIPGQTMGVSVFTDRLIDNLAISRTMMGFAYLLGTICSGFLVSWMGRWLDRHGIRKGAVVAGFGMGLALVILSQVDRIAGFLYPGQITAVGTGVKFAAVTGGFFLLRFFGQGLMTLASRNMIAKWFDLFRGRVTAVSGIVVSFAFSVAPWGLERLIDQVGWRGTWLLLALFFGLFFLLFAAVFFRDNPEECGLEMDAGQKARPGGRVNEDNRVVRDFTKSEAIRTYSFWVYNIAIALQGFLITGYTFHLTSVADDFGIAHSVVLGAFLPAAAIGVFVSIGVGWLIDWTRMKHALTVFCAGMVLFPLGLLTAPDFSGIAVMVLGLGIAGGSFAPIMGTVWARFFGRRELGGISGFNMSSIVIASAFGPIVFSLSYDYLGGYRPAVYLSLFSAVALMMAGRFAENPQRKLQHESERNV